MKNCMRRKHLVFMLTLLLTILLGVSKENAFAGESSEEEFLSGTCGEHVTWTMDKKGLLTITGSGEMQECLKNGAKAPWYDDDRVKRVVIEEGVTNISNGAFWDCYNLSSVEIPESVTSIGDNAFSGCSKLKSLEIPKGVISIGESAFYNCKSLLSIEIPNGVSSIGNMAFYNCKGLLKMEIPNSVKSIGDSSFGGCSGLKSVNISSNLKSITRFAFYGCDSLTSVEIPNGVTSIDSSAFSECSSLKSVKISNSVKKIDDCAFDGCRSLQSVEIPNSVKSIGDNAFDRCNKLASAIIPKSVTSIGDMAFGYINMNDNSVVKNTGLTITTTEGSKADQYADNNGIKVLYKDVIGESISAKSVSLKETSLVYTGKALTPEVTVKDSSGKVVASSYYTVTYKNNKNVGTATITIKGKNGYTGTATKTFTIVPKATELSLAKNSVSKAIALTWKKNATGAGYEIQYSTDKNFKKGVETVSVGKNTTTKATIKNLMKNRKYYVRIRAIKTVSKKKYCSAWSAAKVVTVVK